MNKYFIKALLMLFPLIFGSCLFSGYPVDEDDLLITDREECYISRFKLLGTDMLTVHFNDNDVVIGGNSDAYIDTVACIIHVKVKYGTDLRNVYPQFTLITDAKLEPKVTGFTDFSDYKNNPPRYTVVSGNRKVKRTYTINIEEHDYQIQ
ncbi:MAG: hypothetical protein ACK5L7_00910 [Paludibacteraceae bacterium]